ncbi:MAG: hypothetical protein U1E76_26225 [Planctomycetota bacterium]
MRGVHGPAHTRALVFTLDMSRSEGAMSLWFLVLIRLLVVPAPQDAQVTTRAYDVRDLVWVSGSTAIAFDLCPARPSGGIAEHPEVAAAGPPVDLERVRETLQEIAARRWPEDVVRITAAEPRLFVTAPEPIQSEVAQLLMLMRDACGRDERLQVRVLVGDGLLDLPMLLDAALADRRAADLVATKRAQVVRTAAATLRDGLTVTMHAVDTRIYTRDYDVEIAGSSVVFDPVIDTATHGLEAAVRAVRVRGGTYLDLAMRHAIADQWRDRVLEPQTWCANLKSSASTSPLQLAPRSSRTCASACRFASTCRSTDSRAGLARSCSPMARCCTFPVRWRHTRAWPRPSSRCASTARIARFARRCRARQPIRSRLPFCKRVRWAHPASIKRAWAQQRS